MDNATRWTPITEGLPPIGRCLIVTVYNTPNQRRELRYPVEYRQSMYTDDYGYYLPGGVYLSPQRNEVLAWTMIPNVWEGEQNG